MHPMPMHTDEKDLTGKFRFRRQPLTGKAILQVQITQHIWRRPSTHFPAIDRESNSWRDATMEEAYSIQMKSEIEEARQK